MVRGAVRPNVFWLEGGRTSTGWPHAQEPRGQSQQQLTPPCTYVCNVAAYTRDRQLIYRNHGASALAAQLFMCPPACVLSCRAAELGHLKCDHGLWLTVANVLAMGTVSLLPIISGTPSACSAVRSLVQAVLSSAAHCFG